MKKHLILLAITLMAVVTGCKKDPAPENKLAEGIELPPLTEQFIEGAPITVKGSGFTTTDVIVFRVPTKATTDVVAEITEVTATQITFIVPSGLTAGENSIVLKRSGEEQVLGSVSIAEMADAQLYGFDWSSGSGERCVIYSIDKTTGVLTEIKTLPAKQDLASPVAIGRVAYGVYYPMTGNPTLGSFDFDTKTYKSLGQIANFQCLGVIDGKLHVITGDEGAILLSQVNTETGALTLIADFGKVEDAENFNGIDAPFIYDAKNKTILAIGWWYIKNQGTQAQPITLNVEKKSIALLPRFTETGKKWESLFAKGEQIGAVIENSTTDNGVSYDLYTLGSKYELDKKLSTIKEFSFLWQYDAKTDSMYSVYQSSRFGFSEKGVCSLNLKTGTFNKMSQTVFIDNVILVR